MGIGNNPWSLANWTRTKMIIQQSVDSFNALFPGSPVWIREDSYNITSNYVSDHTNGEAADINANDPQSLLLYFLWMREINFRPAETAKQFPGVRGIYISDHNYHLHVYTVLTRTRRYQVEHYDGGATDNPSSYSFQDFDAIWSDKSSTLQNRYGTVLNMDLPKWGLTDDAKLWLKHNYEDLKAYIQEKQDNADMNASILKQDAEGFFSGLGNKILGSLAVLGAVIIFIILLSRGK
jgi:hypothetical protein